MKIRSAINSRGSILLYAILFANIAFLAAYIISSYGQVLLGNLEYQNVNLALGKNLSQKAKLAISYDKSMNKDGTGFVDTTSCPTSVYMSGISLSGTVITSPRYGADGNDVLFCEGMYQGQAFWLKYNASGSNFAVASGFLSQTTLAISGTGWHTGDFGNADTTHVSFSATGNLSGISLYKNSNDYRATSTGGIVYPNGGMDNDILARKITYGVARKGAGMYNIFWNNTDIVKEIHKNINNNDSTSVKMGDATVAYFLADFDNPFTLKVVEFSSGSYTDQKKLQATSTLFSYSGTGAIGYIGATGLVSTTPTAYAFDLKNKNYGFFLSFDGNASVPSSVYLKYKLSATSSDGKGIYIVPIDDSGDDIEMLATDILADKTGGYFFRQETTKEDK